MGLRYGQGLYGTGLYGPGEPGFQFKVIVSSPAGAIQGYLNNEIISMNWEFRRQGGCGPFEMRLKRQYGDMSKITAQDLRALNDIQIYITSEVAGSSVLYYRGYITNIRPNLSDREETIVSGVGYGARLRKLQVNDGTGAPLEYSNMTVSEIVTAIINDFVTPNTPITEGTIDDFDLLIESIKFNGTAEEAIKKLAEIVGAEFGVDRNLEIYFVQPETDIAWRFLTKKDIGLIEDEYDWSDMVNRVYIEGGRVDGVPFRYVKENTSLIDAYGLLEERITNSSVIDADVASQLADSILATAGDFVRNVRIELPFNKELLEADTPLGRLVIVEHPKLIQSTYGSVKYGEGIYNGEQEFQIDRIQYELRDASLFTSVEMNAGKPDIVDRFEEIEFALEQQRQEEGV